MEVTKEQREAVRREWVKALRSGEYKQGTCGLVDLEGGYCCLGVLCLVVEDMFPHEIELEDGRENGQIPDAEIIDIAGLRDECWDFVSGSLVSMNDYGTPFTEIADVIESRPEGLFVG